MDSRIYFHQYRRPRFSNPTYMSNNINHSMKFFNDQTYQPPSYPNQLSNSPNFQQYSRPEQGERSQAYSLNKPNTNANRERYNTINGSFEQPSINPTNSGRYSGGNPHQRNHSNLSSYGSNSLSLNQNDIYNKQNSKFNIITMQPKEFDTSIRQHPKYTLQNKDELYYKRMGDELQKKKMYEQSYKQKRSPMQGTTNNPTNTQMIAGKHTYGMDKQGYSNRTSAPEQSYSINPQTFTNQYKLSQVSNNKGSKQFNPKLLSHMDQLISLS